MNMKTQSILALVFITSLATAGEPLPDLTLPIAGGVRKLEKVELVKVEPDGIRVIHSAGMAKVPFESLPVELQKKYGYDPAKAKVHREATNAAVAESRAKAEKEANEGQARERAAATTTTGDGTNRLYTADEIKALWLTKCDPRTVNSLDKDAAQKRSQMTKFAQELRNGGHTDEAALAAAEWNAQTLSAKGDAEGAAREGAQAAAIAAKIKAQGLAKAKAMRDNEFMHALIYGPSRRSLGGG